MEFSIKINTEIGFKTTFIIFDTFSVTVQNIQSEMQQVSYDSNSNPVTLLDNITSNRIMSRYCWYKMCICIYVSTFYVQCVYMYMYMAM